MASVCVTVTIYSISLTRGPKRGGEAAGKNSAPEEKDRRWLRPAGRVNPAGSTGQKCWIELIFWWSQELGQGRVLGEK